MPPKKTSEKAIAAETKKQNTVKAKSILDELRKEVESGGGSVVKKSSRKKTEKDTPVSSDKKLSQTKGIANPKPTISDKVAIANSKPTTEDMPNSTVTSGGGINDPPERTETPPRSSTLDQSVEISKPKPNESGKRKAAANVVKKNLFVRSKAGSSRSHGNGYQYEIDCKNVADSIDVNDLKVHLEKHLKIDGKKNNLGSTVQVVCEGQKVVINSATFFPKKSLRFLSKKFLKKNWNIRVVYKNSHSYEYKYVGMP